MATEKREREIKEGEEAEQRAQRAHEARRQLEQQHQQQVAATNSANWEAWWTAVDQRIEAALANQTKFSRPQTDALGQVIAELRAYSRKEAKAAIEEERRSFEARLQALEERLVQQVKPRLIEPLEQCSERTSALSESIATERGDRQTEVKQAIEEERRAVESKFAVLEERIVQHTDGHADERIIHDIEQCSGRIHALSNAITTERTTRSKEIKTAVEEAKRAVETQLATLGEHIVRHAEQRITQHIEQCSGHARALDHAIETERADRQKEVSTAFEEAKRAGETKLTALEQRLKAVPGKLPVARAWLPESVTYQGEFVSCEGQTWQACRDTARKPGDGLDWHCIARAGRDAVTPTVLGTFDVHETYKLLDLMAPHLLRNTMILACVQATVGK